MKTSTFSSLTCLLFCLFSLGTYTTCDAKISLWDYYASTEEWQFVSNFCYAKQGGKLIVEVLPTNLDTDAMVTFYPDMQNEWFRVYEDYEDTSCQYKVDQARYGTRIASIANMPDQRLVLDVDGMYISRTLFSF